jgi:geranylgeranyl reductase family protein
MNYDVIVVGAGPSGSTAAKILAEKGIKVLLVDKNKFPRDKPCGGGLPLRTLAEFPYIKKLQAIESYSYGGFVYSPTSNSKVEINKTEPVIAMVQRSKFDHELLQLSIDKGTEFQENRQVTNIKISQDSVQLTFKNSSTVTAELIIGADGYHSTIARKTQLSQRNLGRGICILEEIPMKREKIEQIYSNNLLCHIHSKFKGIKGYGWVFPKKHHINIGIVSYDNIDQLKKKHYNLKILFTEYLTQLKETNLLPTDIQSTNIKGGLLPLRPVQKTYTDRVLLTGDAAGLINPISGEGIYYAICSGKLAGMTAVESIRNQNTTEKYLSTYQKRWKQAFGKEINLFLLGKNQWGKRGETIIKLMNKDPVFAELIYSIFIGKESVYDLRWKIIKRFLYSKLSLK